MPEPPAARAHAPDAIEIRRETLSSTAAQALIGALNAELSARYPEDGATHFRLEAPELQEGRGAFLVAYAEGRPFACGAVRRLDPETAEIKRMYVEAASRGRGFGRVMLDALLDEARRLGVSRVVLETGERQGEALGLYARAGFRPIERFGEYVDSPLSICMARDI